MDVFYGQALYFAEIHDWIIQSSRVGWGSELDAIAAVGEGLLISHFIS